MFSTKVFALDTNGELTKANEHIEKSIEAVKAGDLSRANISYEEYNQAWIDLEDGVKAQSKQAYGEIESKMGMVHFLFAQTPVQNDKVLSALEDL